MFNIKRNFMQFLFFAICVVLVNCGLEAALLSDNYVNNNPELGNDAPMAKRPAFFVGSRYGRSGGDSSSFASSKSSRLKLVPRSDRFFLGSRYGKRMAPYMPSPSLDDGTTNEHDADGAAVAVAESRVTNDSPVAMNTQSEMNAGFMMSCLYTGVKNLYRCNNMDEINYIMNKLTDGTEDGDRK